jgi:dienelactone hydrolase
VWRRGPDGASTELTPGSYVRSTVHEYGGGAWHTAAGVLVWTSFPDGAVWVRRDDDEPRRLVEGSPWWRYGDLRVHPDRDLVLAVREEHPDDGPVVNTVVALALDGDPDQGGTVLCAGADFYAGTELSADGRLAWTQWDHPNMPWDGTELRVATLTGAGDDLALADPVTVAGGPQESAAYPRWLPGGALAFCSDRSDWWNLYGGRAGPPRAGPPTAAEFCGPPWMLGQHPYAVIDDDRILCHHATATGDRLAVLDLRSGELTTVPAPGDAYGALAADREQVALLAGSPTGPPLVAVAELGPGGATAWRTVRRSTDLAPDAGLISRPEAVTWPGRAGVVHGWFYPPTLPDVTGPAAERPPLITVIHGGPTSAARATLDLGTQFWTSRGFAVLDVNYSGSTGYGRAYRNRLRGRWGELDVTDCADGARAMAEQGRADPDRLAIMGGSAGGFTVLRALTYTDDFAAGVSLYGVGDLEGLATDTHKFESRYLDGLVGPYPADAATYRDRSPIHHVEDLSSPILLLQGGQDKVVPLNQAETFAAAARTKGLPVALIVFPEEGHGFRAAASIATTLEATLSFFGRVFGFAPADDLALIEIENLPDPAQSGQ